MKLYKRGLIKIMELIYLYIKQCENVFENVEFNFSSNYIATMKNNELLVKENQNTVKNYYGNNVNSVSDKYRTELDKRESNKAGIWI